jgi:hypothetical protein
MKRKDEGKEKKKLWMALGASGNTVIEKIFSTSIAVYKNMKDS